MAYRIDVIPAAHIPRRRAATFSYTSPHKLTPGSLIRVPFGPRTVFGIVHATGTVSKNPKFALKPVDEIVTQDPFFPARSRKYLAWEAKATLSSIGDVLDSALPGWLALKARRLDIPPQKHVKEPAEKSTDNMPSVTCIAQEPDKRISEYQKLIEKATEGGQQSLILAPSLARAKALLGELSGAEAAPKGRTKKAQETWFQLRDGEPLAIVGTKNDLRLPFTNLGIIIVDDEGNELYKESRQRPYTDAREGAKRLAAIHSATYVAAAQLPLIETLHLMKSIPDLSLTQLPGSAEIIDLKDHPPRDGLAPPLRDMLQEFAESGEGHALFYLNRLGDALALTCRDCGYVFNCEQCEAPMPVYAASRIEKEDREGLRLKCRHCGEIFIPPLVCPACRGFDLIPRGLGSAALADYLGAQFPTIANVFRLDSDAAASPKAQREIINAFSKSKKPGILVATSMAFMHQLPDLNLIAVPAFDHMGAVPDFRADEQTIRTLLRLRGRLAKKGILAIQAWHADRPQLTYAAGGDLNAFVQHELSMREAFGWPPYTKVAKLTFAHKDVAGAMKEANALAKKLSTLSSIEVAGPTPAFIPKVKGKARQVLLLKWEPDEKLNIEQELAKMIPPRWEIDVSPMSLL